MKRQIQKNCTVVDLFAGAGGLTHGFFLEGFNVAAGVDADDSFRYAYEKNNPGAAFVHKKVEDLRSEEVKSYFSEGRTSILAGCAPCQPFSSYTRIDGKHENWKLLTEFSRIVKDVVPDLVTMENVPRILTYDNGSVLRAFLKTLEENGYHVYFNTRIYAPAYGVPQTRYRFVLIASKFGKVEFIEPTYTSDNYPSVRDAIGDLENLAAGEISKHDPLHRSMRLSELNLLRIKASKPGESWRNWPEGLRAECHNRKTGKWYQNVYGRMAWDEPSPTITTQCYGYGNGRFGHPEQNRAISLREAALLQTFPANYEFFDPSRGKPSISKISRMIGNAVPVELARMIARSIKKHLEESAAQISMAN